MCVCVSVCVCVSECVSVRNRRLIIKGFFLSTEGLFILYALVKVFLVRERGRERDMG